MTDNELIAEFMGITVRPIGNVFYIAEEDGYVDLTEASVYWPEGDWNQLMPAVATIHAIGLEDENVILSDYYRHLTDLAICANIETVYKRVVGFIKCYNENKTK